MIAGAGGIIVTAGTMTKSGDEVPRIRIHREPVHLKRGIRVAPGRGLGRADEVSEVDSA